MSMWKEELRASLRTPGELLNYLALDASVLATDMEPLFKVFVPPRWLDTIEKANPNDPLLRQVLSSIQELDYQDHEPLDALDEKTYSPLHGLLHKYAHRVLIITSGACPIHCRYCFRRHFPYQDNALTEAAWQHILSYVRNHTDIFEVILSGGDPLMLSTARLSVMLSELTAIPHIRSIRIHTRFPTTIPSRFTEDLWSVLGPYGKKITWVWHINHAKELGKDVELLSDKAHSYNMKVFAQTVLLKGVNDDITSLRDLMWALNAHGIIPYYLHQLDSIRGVDHYKVAVSTGLELIEGLRASLPGYLVPRYVKEIPNKPYKTPLFHDLVDVLI